MMIKRIFFIVVGLFGLGFSYSQEVPKVIHFTKQDYRAQNQNWDIAQGADHQLFVANSGGLLQYDGVRWRLHATPAGQIIRAVAVDTTGKVFVGGFETMGYWEAGPDGSFAYHSLLGLMAGNSLGNEEIWHILLLPGKVLFQSFSTIYSYDYQQVTVVQPPGNIMFARRVGEGTIVPVINDGLYLFEEQGTFTKIPGSEIFADKVVSGILSDGTQGILVGTQKNGVFAGQNGTFSQWETPLNKDLTNMQLNQCLRLKNGDYVFGTILGGIHIATAQGKLLRVINQEKGLQNNTILSLLQDRAGQLWAGLDNGLDQIVLDSPLLFFQDKTGEIGTVYAAAIFDGKLYLGTNHGVFYKPYPLDEAGAFQLVNGSQGQVWDLQVFDNQLIGGHNSGTIRITDDQVEFLFNDTGIYTTTRHPGRPDLLLQGTYTGIIVFRKNQPGSLNQVHTIEGFAHPARKLLFDDTNRLWVLHARKGLFRLTLDEGCRRSIQTETFLEQDGLPSMFQLDMVRMGEEIIFQSENQFFTYDDRSGRFIKKENMAGVPLAGGEFLLQGGRAGDWFKIFPDQVHYFTGDQRAVFYLPLVRGNERIVTLPGGGYLFCQDDGYAILPFPSVLSEPVADSPPPLITGISLGKQNIQLEGVARLGQPYTFGPAENQLTFQFACPHFIRRPAMRYRLLGFDDNWSSFETTYSKEFTNLSPGEYRFELQSGLSEEITAFDFSIEPRWYQTVWAQITYALLFMSAFFLLLKWHERRMEHQRRQLEAEKEQELERQRTHAKNELLQAEVLNKSRILADTTMNLIRKNEMLTKIKEELEQATRKKSHEAPARVLTKMEHLIDAHLSSEEDWQVFEANFNLLHDQFFKRLKEQYPNLTPGDLRLAAYLKMNLSSKEIAPLLNISVRGVENKRYRLRQKMELDGEVNLTEYLMAF